MSWTIDQEAAINNSGTNIIVSAGAGSGKTAVLTERVITKIQNGTHVNELLILTFTNAAAAEMKDRIRNKISKLPNLSDELNLLGSAYITTFDSFALSIVKKYHYILNISDDISITDESIVTIKRNEILDDVFNEFYEKGEDDFCKFINKYCDKNDSDLKESILKLIDGFNKYININERLDNIRINFFDDECLSNLIHEYFMYLESKRNSIKELVENLNSYFDYDYCDKVYEILNSFFGIEIFELYSLSSPKLPNAPRGSSEESKNYKALITDSIKELLASASLGNAETIKNDILNSRGEVFVILDILEKYFKKLDVFKKENNIYTFKDIAFLATKIVSENEGIRCELRDSFKEIMIDEYQDTNDIQDNFIKMISNQNVYMVGDIKQSIYRFNNANPSIFKEKYDNYSKLLHGEKIDLIKNFRSRSEVLNSINTLFEKLMDNDIGGCNYKESHEMIYGFKDYDILMDPHFVYDMEINQYNKVEGFSNKEIEMFSIAKDIKSKIDNHYLVYDKDKKIMREITYSDFAIILAESTKFETYKKVFEYFGIPLYIFRDEKLTSTTDLNLIKNIIDIIIRIYNNDLGDSFKYDFMSIGRSFLYEINDGELFDAFVNNTFKDSKIYKDFSNIENFNSMTCGEVIDYILLVTDFYNKIYKVGNYDEIDNRIKTIMDLACSFNNLKYSIFEFRDYLDKILESGIDITFESNIASTDSVKIMTIHKSKGLEYPVCYFASLDTKFNIKDFNTKFIYDYKYGLMIPYDNNKDSISRILYKESEMQELISEKIRLFYVALTRAREKIIIYLPNKDLCDFRYNEDGIVSKDKRMEFRCLADLIYSCFDKLTDYISDVDIDALELSKKYLSPKSIRPSDLKSSYEFFVNEISIDNEELIEEKFSKDMIRFVNKENQEKLEYGIKIHEYLEYIDFNNYDESKIDDKFVRGKINALMKSDLFKDIKDAKFYQEYEFTYTEDDKFYHGIIDLIIEHDDHIDIVDYKLKNVTDDNYKKQLEGYKKYLSSIQDKDINIYLYSILDECVYKL